MAVAVGHIAVGSVARKGAVGVLAWRAEEVGVSDLDVNGVGVTALVGECDLRKGA